MITGYVRYDDVRICFDKVCDVRFGYPVRPYKKMRAIKKIKCYRFSNIMLKKDLYDLVSVMKTAVLNYKLQENKEMIKTYDVAKFRQLLI